MKTLTNLSTLAAVAAVASLAFGSPGAQAQATATKPAQQCMTDLPAFDSRLKSDGYWLHGSGYGYGYPMYGYGYAYGGERLAPASSLQATGYWRARPGYEVRTLLASANILAQRCNQHACEGVLGSAREVYTSYVADLRSGKIPRVEVTDWRRQQISTAVAVTGADMNFRSGELVGAVEQEDSRIQGADRPCASGQAQPFAAGIGCGRLVDPPGVLYISQRML